MHMSDLRGFIAIYPLSFISIFSLSGYIFSIKRRRLGYQTSSDLVFLKLNENLLMD
jgi:hypothetical protein